MAEPGFRYEKTESKAAREAFEKLSQDQREALSLVVDRLCKRGCPRGLDLTPDGDLVYRHPETRFVISLRECEGEPPKLEFTHYEIAKGPKLPRRGFVSYAREDGDWLDELRKTLKPLERNGRLEVWADPEIRAGDDWEESLLYALAHADLTILLISRDFIQSDYIADRELKLILAAREERDLPVLWILARPAKLEYVEGIKRFQGLSQPDRPLSRMKSATWENELNNYADEIERVLDALPS